MAEEQKLQTRIKNYLRGQGWKVIKTILLSENGHPDLFCAKNGRLILIEVKAKGEVPDPLQEYRIKEWNKNGFTAFYADSFESFLSQWIKTC